MTKELTVVTLATDIRREHKAAQTSASDAVAHARRCGELLLQAKAARGHGHFMKWVTKHTEIDQRMANRYMSVAKLDGPNWTRVSNLTLRKALSGMPQKRTRDAASTKTKKATSIVTKPGDLLAKRIIKQLEGIGLHDLTDPAWFAGQLHYHASRLNPLKMVMHKGK